jgi:hypothetical protein
MRRFQAAQVLAALICLGLLLFTTACSGAAKVQTPVAASITLSPSTVSVNEGQVVTLRATALNSAGVQVTVDYTFTSSNPALASVSSAGLVCGGSFDANSIVCSPNGDGQATITVTSGSASATAPVYVHKQVDRVVVNPFNDCESSGTLLNPSATVYNTTAPGCSPSAPCDITSTVGPIAYGSGNLDVVATAAGINPTFNSSSNSPTYAGGGTITGSKGQTCNLTNFSVGGGTGIDPTFDPSKNSPSYVSGGTISGTAGQTCTLSNFNGLTAATALVTLTEANAIAPGSHLTITSPGSGGGTTPPTTATFSNGTATCSGTANVITSLLTTTGIDPVVDATGTVTLTGTNTIAVGTQLTITNQGFGAVQAPTTATLSNGTATCTGTAGVITALNSATGLQAQSPGTTAVFAGVAGVNSVGTPLTVCPVQSILVHDANSSATNFTLQAGQTQNLVADVLDSKGVTIHPNLNWGNTQTGVATIVGSNATASLVGFGPGTTIVTATCVAPNCNIGLPPQYSSDVVTATIAGQSPDHIYVASSKSLSMVPIDVVTNAVGTAITLPNYPNSILASPTGNMVFLGTGSGGVMFYNVSTATVTAMGFNGTVLAVSSDGTLLLVADFTANATYLFDVTDNVKLATFTGTAIAGAITPDSQWSLSLVGQGLVRSGDSVPVVTTNLSYTPNFIDLLSQGSLAFITSSGSHSIDVRSTCDRSDMQTLNANSPTLVRAIPDGTGAVAVDAPQIDVITTPQPTGSCPTMASSALTTYDLQAGSFNAGQLLVSYDSSNAWILTDQNFVLLFNLSNHTPTPITLANNVQALSGALTLDSSQLYVGANDGNVHRVVLNTLADELVIVPGLKDANSNVALPDLLAVLPK